MANTHSTVKHFDDIGKLYTESIATEGQLVDAAPAKDIAFAKDAGHDVAKDTGPEAADGFAPAENDPKKLSDKDLENAPHNTEKLSQNVEKESVDQINNSTMKENTNKSTFDRLFEDVMGEEFEDLGMAGGDLGDDMDMGGEDDMGDDEGEMISIPRDLARQLHDHLGEILGGDDDEGGVEDLEDVADLGDEVEEESHVELANAPDGTQLTHVGNNKAGNLNPTGGSASGDAGGQEDGGKPKAAKDGKGTLQNKNNKVAHPTDNAFGK